MKPAHTGVSLLAGATLLLALLVSSSLWSIRQVEISDEARKRIYVVMALGDGVLSALSDAEAGQRGYALTGDETYLAPYLTVRDGIGKQVSELRKHNELTAGRPHVDALVLLVETKLAEMARVIELRRNQDLPAMIAAERDGQGKRLMDSIRAEIGSLAQLEKSELARHQAEFASSMRLLFAIIVIATLVTVLLALSFAYLVVRETHHRLKAEETARKLQQANAALRDNENRLAVTLHSIGEGVMATDTEGRVTFLNPHAERLTGWRHEEANGRSVDDIFRIVSQKMHQSSSFPVKDTLAKGAIQGLAKHAILVARDGAERAIADNCAPILDRDDQVVGAVRVFRDITDESATQRILRDSEEQYRQLFESSRDALIILKPPSWSFTDANREAVRLFGAASKEGFISLGPRDVAPERQPDGSLSAEKAQEMIAAALRDGSHLYEWQHQRLNGEPFAADVLLTRVEARDSVWLQATVRDISTLKAAENALSKSETLQRAIFNSANFSSIATDAKGVIQLFNVGAERMLGYTAAEVMNKITPADISDPQEVIERAKALSVELSTPITPGFEALVFKASRGIEDIYELTYIRKDGSRFPAVVSVTALRDAKDAIIGYLLIGTDNTARKQIEAEQKLLDQRLRDQQFYTRSLIESNTDAIMTTDSSGIITDVNKQMEALTGCTRDELIGAPFRNYFTDAQRAQAGIKLVLSEKRVSDYELTARARDGKETVVSFNATTFYDRDRTLQGVFAAARDVTERKRLDQVLRDNNVELERARSAAEKANLAKSDFLSSMSHELRSPLNAILGFAQLMESDSLPATPAHKESIAQILQAGWHLLKLIDEILDLAKVESRQVPLSREPVSLAEVMLECQGMIEPLAQQREVRMTFPPFDVPCFVLADRTRVKQVLINLLSNAIKYNVKRGSVEVTCTEGTPGRTRVSIRDTGAGLHPEEVAQLFQAFNRFGQEAGGEKGTGIGLVVAKRLVELMRGTIGAESTVGKGSVFWFELMSTSAPGISMEEGKAEVRAEPLTSRGGRLHTLLYVEDNPANLKLVEQIVARHPDLRLLTALDGNRGIAIARASRPDLILMDINLPGINGFEALKLLRSDPATATIPAIAISANAMPLDVEKGLTAGFVRYLTKPIKVNEFLEALDMALDPSGHQARSEQMNKEEDQWSRQAIS